jgi:drug/metabolite transporter (DMT)-like permease
MAAVVLSQRPTGLQWAGAVLVCGGVLAAARSARATAIVVPEEPGLI